MKELDMFEIRKDYKKEKLTLDKLDNNPVETFIKWFNLAKEESIYESNIMVLSTVKDGKPRSRVVLLKLIKDGKFYFFTNYNSDKANEIKDNDNVALNFYWDSLQRQVRIEGKIKKCKNTVSDEYFKSRPKMSQISAISSPQSKEIKYKDLVKIYDYNMEKLKDTEIKRPDNWGGYEIEANYFEFWQGGENRLHDRYVYQLVDNNWKIKRIAP